LLSPRTGVGKISGRSGKVTTACIHGFRDGIERISIILGGGFTRGKVGGEKVRKRKERGGGGGGEIEPPLCSSPITLRALGKEI